MCEKETGKQGAKLCKAGWVYVPECKELFLAFTDVTLTWGLVEWTEFLLSMDSNAKGRARADWIESNKRDTVSGDRRRQRVSNWVVYSLDHAP